MTASSDAEPTTEDQVAGGEAMREAVKTAPLLDVPTSDPSSGDQLETAASLGVESQSPSATNEGDSSGPRTRVVVYARPPELRSEQSGAAVGVEPAPASTPETESKAEPKPDSERPSYSERARLNAMDSWFRGTALGAFTLNRLYRLSYLQDGEEETPERRAQIEFFKPQYQKITHDLASFDNMAGFSNFGEAASAFVGQFGASLLSPEGWIPAVKGGTLLARTVKGGLTQAGIQLGTDPVVQWLSIKSRVQESYDPVRTVAGAAFGFVGGSVTSALARPRVGRPTPPGIPEAPPSAQESFQVAAAVKTPPWLLQTEIGGGSFGRGGGPTTSAPNPWGRLGGPEHRAKVKERGDALEAQGHKIIGGGGRHPEQAVPIPGGRLRFPDITTRDPLGNLYYENIGRLTKNGIPIARERRPLEDFGKTGERFSFTPIR